MTCDLCWAEAEFKALVEGTEVTVCKNCSRYGKIIGRLKKEDEKREEKQALKRPEKEVLQVIVPDYAKIIRDRREAMGLKQKDFARMISEKESLIHKMEIGSFEPGIDLARKLERFLKVKLIEQHEEEIGRGSRPSDETLTLGDFVKVRKR